MQALPSIELLDILWVLELRSGTHPSVVHRAILFNVILLILF